MRRYVAIGTGLDGAVCCYWDWCGWGGILLLGLVWMGRYVAIGTPGLIRERIECIGRLKIDRKEMKCLEKDVSGFHNVNHNFHTICPERQHWPVR